MSTLSLLLALAAPPDGGSVSPWVQLGPVCARPGDLLLHHPDADAASAEEGRGVSPESQGRRQGHHNRRAVRQHHAARRPSLQLQIADKVRVEIARSAIIGFQGQEPVAAGRTVAVNKSLRWKVHRHRWPSSALGAWAIYPPEQKVRLGLDLKGGVHLVLRVQTDDALRLETETSMNRLREELVKAGGVRRHRHGARARPSFRSPACRPSRTACSARRRPRSRRRSTASRARPARTRSG